VIVSAICFPRSASSSSGVRKSAKAGDSANRRSSSRMVWLEAEKFRRRASSAMILSPGRNASQRSCQGSGRADPCRPNGRVGWLTRQSCLTPPTCPGSYPRIRSLMSRRGPLERSTRRQGTACAGGEDGGDAKTSPLAVDLDHEWRKGGSSTTCARGRRSGGLLAQRSRPLIT
jgi:hypothetical protein